MSGQLGLVSESVYGTAPTVTKFFPVENAQQKITEEKLNRDDDIIAGDVLLPGPSKLGRRVVNGSARMKLPNAAGAATLYKHIFGVLTSTAGSNPYTHTFGVGAPGSLAIQAGAQDAGDTVRPFTHSGCQVTDWEITVDNKGWAKLNMSWVGKDYTTATALASASYATMNPFTFVEGAATLGGSPATTVKNISIKGTRNRANDRFVINNSRTILQPRNKGKWQIGGTIQQDFEDLTMVNAIAAATPLACTVVFGNGTDTLTLTMNIVLDGDFPSLTGQGLEEQPLNFRVERSGTTNASGFVATLVNTEASAA